MSDLPKLDLACGSNPQPGYIPVDNALSLGAGVVRQDLTAKRWQWASGSIGGIYCSHFVEHVPDLVAFMNEVDRILAPGSQAVIVHPYQHSNRAWQDPTHVRALNEDSWRYYSAAERAAMGVDHYLGISANLIIAKVEFILSPWWQKALVENGWTLETPEVVYAMRHAVNVIDDLVVTLLKP